MNSHPDSDSTLVQIPPAQETTAAPAKVLSVDDEFEGEELGERPADVCSLEEGCTTCQ